MASIAWRLSQPLSESFQHPCGNVASLLPSSLTSTSQPKTARQSDSVQEIDTTGSASSARKAAIITRQTGCSAVVPQPGYRMLLWLPATRWKANFQASAAKQLNSDGPGFLPRR